MNCGICYGTTVKRTTINAEHTEHTEMCETLMNTLRARRGLCCTYVILYCNLDAAHPARGHGRVLRVGRAARRPVAQGPPRGRRRAARRTRRRRRRELRSARVRRPLGDVHGAGRAPVPVACHRAARVSEVPRRIERGLLDLPRGHA